MNRPYSIAYAFTLALIPLLLSCGHRRARPAKEPANPEVPVTYAVPVVTPVIAGTEMQEKKGVTISVIPVEFKITEGATKRCVPARNSKLYGFITVTDSSSDPSRSYTVTTEQGFVVAPSVITFGLTVTNHTNHIMKLAGTVPKLNVNSRTVEVAQAGKTELDQAVLVPNETRTFTLAGPAWSEDTEKATITFELWDVSVEVNDAGNTTLREHFEWTYQAVVEKKTVNVRKTVEQMQLRASEAQALGCSVFAGS